MIHPIFYNSILKESWKERKKGEIKLWLLIYLKVLIGTQICDLISEFQFKVKLK